MKAKDLIDQLKNIDPDRHISHHDVIKIIKNNKSKWNDRNIIRKYSIDYILREYKKSNRRIEKVIEGQKRKISCNRFELYLKSTTCSGCKLKAKFFAVEQEFNPNKVEQKKKYFFSLYGIKDGEEVLFTKDHIIPKSKGGADNLNNYQVMCWYCNSNKKDNIC